MAACVLGSIARVQAAVLVDDTWQDGARADPAAPVYSENGVDADADGDLESAWFNANGTLTVNAGHLIGTLPVNGTGSASWTTYFTPEASPVTLANAGDTLQVTWVFTPSGVNSSSTSSTGLRLAIVDSPSASRVTSDVGPGDGAYAGYGMFMNMATTLGSSASFELIGRASPSTSSALLSDSGTAVWAVLANGAGKNVTGYASGTQYTFVMTFTRNAASGLDITATMSGGSLNNTGTASVSFTDNTPNSFTFDTFGLRPSSAGATAASFDTTLFKVEAITANTAPSITEDPQDQTVFTNQSATFQVLAAGTSPLNYQWFYNTNTPLADATNSIFTITNAQLTDAGAYSVIITNSIGSVTSAVATLTVNLPNPPSIITQPQDQTVSSGGTATFFVVAGGSGTFSYQWFYNTNTLLPNATEDTLTIPNVQSTNAGSYSVTVGNLAGSITSANASLFVNTNPVAPVFTTQPASVIALAGGNVTFSAVASGSATISYQWSKNNVPIPGATSSTLNLTNVQLTDSGSSFTLTASNSVTSVTSSAAVLTVTTAISVPNTAYNLTGFGQLTTGGGILPDTDPNYAKVYTATDLANAILSKTVKIIEIMTNLNLGYNEIEASAKAGTEPFRDHNAPKLHPVLLQTGVSLIDIQKKNGLTIFSANGATIKHAEFNVKSSANVIIRNLKFDEMWEWDEQSKGNYDENDWDFIDLGNSGTVSNIWVDHCTFTKAYDGIIDIKDGSFGITISWCKYMGDDGATNPNSWVWQQINSLESNKTVYPFYDFLRSNGFSTTDIVTVIQGHDKTHLIGATDKAAINAQHTVTLHHEWFINPWDRLPRLRAGNVHDYNIFVDDTLGLAAKRLRDARAAAMSPANASKLNNTYSFNPFLNGSISTEGGALLVEKSVYIDCVTPLRNNQTDPTDPTYTGKILGLDTIYQFDGTTVRGNSTDPGNPLGPVQAPTLPFSWNLPGNQLPYSYTMDDPAQLQAIVTSPTAGAGAGVLTWAKTNWLLTAYAPSVPVIGADPQNQTISVGNSATFTVVAGGSAPLNYQWYFNTNAPLPGATNSTLTLANVQATNAGVYSVIVTNSAGPATSANAILTVSTGGFTSPQLSSFAFSNGVFSLTINGNSGPDYIVQVSTNLVDWVNIFTNHSPTPPFIWTDSDASNFSRRFYRVQNP
ncbi:MAG TPA: immunoglobulin domain-containing protein [Verrucomicrobiae bacterium]